MLSEDLNYCDEAEHEPCVYSKGEIRSIFYEMKNLGFGEIPESTELAFKAMKVLGFASPFTFKLYINIDRVNDHNWPRKAVIGLLAHELGHMSSYKRRSFFSRMLFIWNYYFSDNARRKVEHEADEIAIQNGYGEELLFARCLAIRGYDDERVKQMKNIYYWPDELAKKIAYGHPEEENS
jgi:hypothetical protein